MIKDSFGRTINYLRLAVTDRCNLRCSYCMPKEGLNWLPQKEIMSYEEMLRLCTVLVKMGIEKIRITGGEPFVRKDLIPFLYQLSELNGLKEITLTTNGILTSNYISDLKKIGIQSVNLSLDTLNEEAFYKITHRNELNNVLKTLHQLLENNINVKINTVVMEDKNIDAIIPLVQLTNSLPVSVRFIEEMPFNGSNHTASLKWNYDTILTHIQKHFPTIQKITDAPFSTSYNYQIPEHQGNIGIIAAYTRSFCNSCNRLRVTPTGMLRICLYEAGKINLKDAIRRNCTDEELKNIITNAVLKKPIDGWEAQNSLVEKNLEHQSMATIGG